MTAQSGVATMGVVGVVGGAGAALGGCVCC